MRLIDADKLKEETNSLGMNDYEPSDFVDIIDEAPTVYPEEVKKLIEMCIRELPQIIEAMTKYLPQLIEAAADKIIEEDTRSEQARWRDGE